MRTIVCVDACHRVQWLISAMLPCQKESTPGGMQWPDASLTSSKAQFERIAATQIESIACGSSHLDLFRV